MSDSFGLVLVLSFRNFGRRSKLHILRAEHF